MTLAQLYQSYFILKMNAYFESIFEVRPSELRRRTADDCCFAHAQKCRTHFDDTESYLLLEPISNKITIFYFDLLYNYKKGICILIQYVDSC